MVLSSWATSLWAFAPQAEHDRFDVHDWARNVVGVDPPEGIAQAVLATGFSRHHAAKISFLQHKQGFRVNDQSVELSHTTRLFARKRSARAYTTFLSTPVLGEHPVEDLGAVRSGARITTTRRGKLAQLLAQGRRASKTSSFLSTSFADSPPEMLFEGPADLPPAAPAKPAFPPPGAVPKPNKFLPLHPIIPPIPRMPKLDLPDLKLPKITMPKIQMPGFPRNLKIPKMPPLPGLCDYFPGGKCPDFNMFKVLGMTLPDIPGVPDMKFPEIFQAILTAIFLLSMVQLAKRRPSGGQPGSRESDLQILTDSKTRGIRRTDLNNDALFACARGQRRSMSVLSGTTADKLPRGNTLADPGKGRGGLLGKIREEANLANLHVAYPKLPGFSGGSGDPSLKALGQHPMIEFEEPQDVVHVRLEDLNSPDGPGDAPRVHWDAVYHLRHSRLLGSFTPAVGGTRMDFGTLCPSVDDLPHRYRLEATNSKDEIVGSAIYHTYYPHHDPDAGRQMGMGAMGGSTSEVFLQTAKW
ncbi:unnamed protein product [Amoebophrya sp. A25]|nr:unnamed protein product [Amoebophrya sp. A25]|eukprot:GSA25T00004008001.1